LIDDKFYRASALITQGFRARQQGDDQKAASFFQQCLALAQDVGMQWFVALAQQQLGFLVLSQGDAPQAMTHFRAALELAWALGRTDNVISLSGCLAVAAQQAQWERAVTLYGAVGALRAILDRPFSALQQADYERATSAVHARRHEPQLAAAWAVGQALSLDQAVAYALALRDLPGPVSVPVEQEPVAPTPPSYSAGLSAREVEVLRLLAEGLTYAQIADRLVISRRTVNAHVTSIYGKLGVTSRAMATHFALENKLL
jgi:DNA-binding CsgD family transcriptional regulator